MSNQTVIIIVTPAVECWGNFKKLCQAKGWNHQTLANSRKVPKLGQPVEIKGHKVYRVEKF